MPCVAHLNVPADRLAALRTVVAAESEPIVTLTHRLQLCRDERLALWERVGILVFPGGYAQTGDDGPVATAIREAAEETASTRPMFTSWRR